MRTHSEIQETRQTLKQYVNNLIAEQDSLYRANFDEISNILSQQKESFEQKINLLKSESQDFSGIVQDSLKGVVTITTDRSLGSGFIITQDGYLVTNYHVIEGHENEVDVITYDKKVISAKFIGADKLRDLALLKLDGEYDYLELADSDNLQVGKKVIAIGNPLGFSFTVTEGIISALDRKGPNGLNEYIQTDVSLNPGNSGGPLIDTSGKVVGINNFKIGGAESLGFALESNSINYSVNAILEKSQSQQ